MPRRSRNVISSLVPTCPRCRSRETYTRRTEMDEIRLRIVRHRECRGCKKRWRTVQGPERFDGPEANPNAA